MGYKMKGYSYPGKSPLKQAIGGDAGEAVDHWKKYQAVKAQDAAVDKLATKKNISRKAFDTKLAKITNTVNPHPKSSMPKNFNMTGKDSWIKESKKILSKGKKIAKKVGKKVIKGIGGKALGVAGMMMAKSASADQPGTGKHGGKKTGKYNPKSGKYE